MNGRLSSGVAAVILCGATASMAQPAAPAAGRLIVSGVVRLSPSSSIGRTTAGLTPGAGQDPYPLFSAAGAIGSHAGLEGALGYRISRSLRVLGVGTIAWPSLAVRIEGDAEGAPALEFAGESLMEWTVGGRAEYDLYALRFARGRAMPFLTAGYQALWQSHEGGFQIESGHVIDAGAGLAFTLRSKPESRVSSVAIVADVRVARIAGGISWNGSARTVPAVGIGVTTAWGRTRKAA